jgi:hypothetical protein
MALKPIASKQPRPCGRWRAATLWEVHGHGHLTARQAETRTWWPARSCGGCASDAPGPVRANLADRGRCQGGADPSDRRVGDRRLARQPAGEDRANEPSAHCARGGAGRHSEPAAASRHPSRFAAATGGRGPCGCHHGRGAEPRARRRDRPVRGATRRPPPWLLAARRSRRPRPLWRRAGPSSNS